MGARQPNEEAARLIEKWGLSGETKIDPALREILEDLVRRGIGAYLHEQELWAEIDPEKLSTALSERWAGKLNNGARIVLRQAFHDIATEVLVDETPKEITRWLWIWNQDDKGTDKAVEQQLFEAIDTALRQKINKILRMQRFAGLSYKIDEGDLVSDLYLKLSKSRIPRLPENSRQFYGLVDKVIQNILKDMQRAAKARPEIPADEIVEMHADKRTGQNQLQVLINAESAEARLAKRLRVDELLKQLPERQQEIFRLRRSGVSVEEIVKMTGWSKATVIREQQKTLAYLIKSLSGDS